MRHFPAPIHHATSAFNKLPGVGPKTALRYVFALIGMSKHDITQFAKHIEQLATLTTCHACFTFSETKLCEICAKSTRNSTQLCIVGESRDIATMEATSAFHGKYFVLGGTLSPIDGRTPETLRIKELHERLTGQKEIEEIILAFSSDMQGETTVLYLAKNLKPFNKKVTRLARGLPMGADIEYADEVTLLSALQGRSEMQ